jgi:MFS family permease
MREVITVLRAEPPYRRLLFASLLSGIGDWFNSVALLSLLLHLTGSGLAVGITLAMRTFPYLVAGPIGGVLADRMDRKVILLISDFARAMIALSFLLIQFKTQVWIAYAGTLGLVVFSALFSPARTAVIPQLVHPDRVVTANSLEQSTTGLVMALGSALGGIVTASFGSDWAFVINSISFLASGILCWSIRFPNDHLSVNANTAQNNPSTFASERTFLRIFQQSRLLQVISLQSFLWPIGGGVINVLLSVYGFQVFHSGNQGVGIMYGALGLGFFFSGFVAHRFTKWIRQAAVAGFVVEGLCHIMVSQASGLWMASFFLVIATVGAGIGDASAMSLIMRYVPKHVHGRVFALFSTMTSVVTAISMLLTSFLLDQVPIRILGFGAGSLIVCGSVITGVGLLRMQLPMQFAQETTPDL